MMMVAMRMIGVASGVRRRGYRGKGDGRRQKHRQENFLHRFSSFETRLAQYWDEKRLIGFMRSYEQGLMGLGGVLRSVALCNPPSRRHSRRLQDPVYRRDSNP